MKTGLVLEGGACKGIFTAGVIDYWMCKRLNFPYVVSVSAGTCNALDYLSKQYKRTKNCMILDNKEDKYYGIDRMLKTGHIFDLDRVFFEYPFKQFPFDIDKYMNSEIVNEIVVTNCNTGKAEYLTEKSDSEKLLLKAKASSSIPLLADMVDIDGEKYLDGGIADSIPVKRAFEQGCDKVVVIMTHNHGYIPSIPKKMHIIYDKVYAKYPNMINAIYNRPGMYRKELRFMEKMEKEGKVLVIRPEITAVKRLETDNDKLERFYKHGFELGRERYDEVMNFIKG